MNEYNSKENTKKWLRRETINSTSNSNKRNILPTIASTGVLLKSLDNTSLSLDIVFILTVRESDVYPPLFRPEDITCIEEKLNRYRNTFLNSGII